MTHCLTIKRKKHFKEWLVAVICIIATILLLVFSKSVKDGINSGIKLVLFNIIPTLFPFFILSDLWITAFGVKEKSRLSIIFQRIFHINPAGLPALLIGMICGFPLGVKSAVEYYSQGLINKDELEILCGFINNPSLAFVISGVGLGIYGNIFDGIFLYSTVLLSALIVGIIFRPKNTTRANMTYISRQSFDFTASINDAGLSCIKIGAFIIFFCALISLFSAIFKNDAFTSVFASVCEIGSAASIIYRCNIFTLSQRKALTAFALGFSGFSIHMQAFSILPKEITKSKYLVMKLTQGILSSIISFIIDGIF